MSDTRALYQPIIDVLSRCKRVLVTTHIRPDGDALGTTAATVLGLRQKNIDAEVLLLSRLPRKYAFIFQDNGIVHHDVGEGWPQGSPSPIVNQFDALLVMDTGTWSQLPGLQDQLKSFTKPKLVVDHHLTQEDWADVKAVDTTASAAGEMTALLLQQWGVTFDQPMATALFLALVSDTGWFQFSNTRPITMRIAADLMEAGVDTDQMYQLLYQNERPERVLLQSRAMQSLELLSDNRVAVMTLRKEDFLETHADVPDTENLINIPLQIRSVEVSLLFVEPKDAIGPIRVSLRSKGQLDCAAFAQHFGGGGHARAAGLKLDATLDSAREKVIAAMGKFGEK